MLNTVLKDKELKDKELKNSEQSQLKSVPSRGSYKKTDAYAIIDQLKLAHISFAPAGQVVAIPMLCWRLGDYVYIHGSRNSRLCQELGNGLHCCLSFALLDAWVMAKSGFHHSANYRSLVLFGQFEPVADEAEQLAAYESFIEQLEPGRWQQIRQPNSKELNVTTLLRMPIAEGSVKCREGGPNDAKQDLDLGVWRGLIPLEHNWGEAIVY